MFEQRRHWIVFVFHIVRAQSDSINRCTPTKPSHPSTRQRGENRERFDELLFHSIHCRCDAISSKFKYHFARIDIAHCHHIARFVSDGSTIATHTHTQPNLQFVCEEFCIWFRFHIVVDAIAIAIATEINVHTLAFYRRSHQFGNSTIRANISGIYYVCIAKGRGWGDSETVCVCVYSGIHFIGVNEVRALGPHTHTHTDWRCEYRNQQRMNIRFVHVLRSTMYVLVDSDRTHSPSDSH